MDAAARKKDAGSKGGEKADEEVDDSTCPIAKNAALLKELDVAEGKVADLLEVAAGALDELAGVESLDHAKVEASTKQFLGLVSEVHGCLSSKASLIRDYTPYPRSIYGPRKELELLHEKARFLRSTLASMSQVSCDAAAPGAASPPATEVEAAEVEAAAGVSKDKEPVSGLPKNQGGAASAAVAATADTASAAGVSLSS